LIELKRALVEADHPWLSIRRQCELLGLHRSSYYYQPVGESDLNLKLMRLIDEQYLRTPFYGYLKMTAYLRHKTESRINPKRVYRLMQLMDLRAVAPRPRTSRPGQGHKIYPYLLRGVSITRPNQVWSADITYVPMQRGFMYLVAVLDWHSRYVLSWEISNTLDGEFCLTALERALQQGKPDIFNTDQGVQFTAHAFTGRLERAGVQISMDGKGRVFDNIFIERLWRTVKYEHIYLNEYDTGLDLVAGLANYFDFYNHERFHQHLGYRTPAQVYGKNQAILA
jgi:putative transposase